MILPCSPVEVPALIDRGLLDGVWLAPGAEVRGGDADPGDDLPAGGGVLVATSGSTGVPKQVVLPADALRAGALATQQVVGALDWTSALPLNYVAGLMTVVRARVAGRDFRQVDASLADLPRPDRPTALSIVATQLHRALDKPSDLVARLAAHTVVLVGGSAIDPGLVERARQSGINAVTTYGMSETCGGCVYDGVPLTGVDVRLDNSDDHGIGRISIGGPMVFAGYHGLPDLTAETLVDRRVVTRDRGQWVDGRLVVLGRLDDVIISGGVNVDLAALQRVLDDLAPGRAVAVGVSDQEWGQSVRLAVVGDEPLEWWRDQLRGRGLQPAALPRSLTVMDELPRTISGKIDRQQLT